MNAYFVINVNRNVGIDDTYFAVQAKTMTDALHLVYGEKLPDDRYYVAGLIDFSKNNGVFTIGNSYYRSEFS